MSRIGRMPIAIPAGVTVDIAENNNVTVKGPKGELTRALPKEMTIKLEDGKIVVERPNDLKKEKSLTKTYTILGHYNVDQINKRGDRLFTTDKEKFARCKSATCREQMYYLTEEEFFRTAKKGEPK